MKLVRMFSLTVIATAVAMAFVGASSAMAVTELEEVVLCPVNENPCTLAFGQGSVFHAELETGTNVLLLSSTVIACESSTILGTTTSLLVHGEITALTFNDCHTTDPVPVFCTVTKEHLNYLFKGELNGAHNGYEVLITEKGTNGRPQVNIKCGEMVECKYSEATILAEQELKAADIALEVLEALNGTGPLCGTIAHPVLHAKYLTRCLEGSGLVGCRLEME